MCFETKKRAWHLRWASKKAFPSNRRMGFGGSSRRNGKTKQQCTRQGRLVLALNSICSAIPLLNLEVRRRKSLGGMVGRLPKKEAKTTWRPKKTPPKQWRGGKRVSRSRTECLKYDLQNRIRGRSVSNGLTSRIFLKTAQGKLSRDSTIRSQKAWDGSKEKMQTSGARKCAKRRTSTRGLWR